MECWKALLDSISPLRSRTGQQVSMIISVCVCLHACICMLVLVVVLSRGEGELEGAGKVGRAGHNKGPEVTIA